MAHKKMRATVQSERAKVKKDNESVPPWDTRAQLAILIPFIFACVFIAICEITGW